MINAWLAMISSDIPIPVTIFSVHLAWVDGLPHHYVKFVQWKNIKGKRITRSFFEDLSNAECVDEHYALWDFEGMTGYDQKKIERKILESSQCPTLW